MTRKRLLRLRQRVIHTRRVLRRRRRAYRLAKEQYRREHLSSKRLRVVKYARRFVGVHEVPAGSNRGPWITDWQKSFGDWLIGEPWCGVFGGAMLRHYKVPVNSRIASVALIEDDARDRVNGFSGWSLSPATARPGDLVVLFGRGVHVGLVVSVDRTAQVLHTIEGNTSPGSAGSQDNGGGVYARVRGFSKVHGIAHVNYGGK